MAAKFGSPSSHPAPVCQPWLFRKFAVDFADRYKSPPLQLDEEAKNVLMNYPWPGNVRQLKNIAVQISVVVV
jgi:DNA-binding NtrC family response regulator